ncbi:HNH endonuclease [Burkholderia multivorans]|uniref:HNH endonuclease n=1 Tax=Burkholderia multivorans TaxID=87883 RepID=UPI001C228CB2|nr:HNH endonuclease signature motif containing protein [Burkholderia multivorans]MBU9468623.1 HNH endonuclease [Burkholderia multivorans]MCA8129559.1 HNH endonuclease [Burkholderia multivorans]
MRTLAQLTNRRAKFEAFLVERGAQILQPTNEWEVLRFKTARGTSIVYCNARGSVTPTGEALKAWDAFERGKPWRAAPAPKKRVKGRDRLHPIYNALVRRDGHACFYCGEPTSEGDRSIEHLVARAHGGPDHLSNMVLAHRGCNASAGHLSVMEKIKIREQRKEA